MWPRPEHGLITLKFIEEAKVPIPWSSDEQLFHKSTKVPPEKARKKRQLVALILKSPVVINTNLSKKTNFGVLLGSQVRQSFKKTKTKKQL